MLFPEAVTYDMGTQSFAICTTNTTDTSCGTCTELVAGPAFTGYLPIYV